MLSGTELVLLLLDFGDLPLCIISEGGFVEAAALVIT